MFKKILLVLILGFYFDDILGMDDNLMPEEQAQAKNHMLDQVFEDDDDHSFIDGDLFWEILTHIDDLENLDGMADILNQNSYVMMLQDEQGNTPLHIAVLNGNVPLVALLLEHGAQLNIQNNFGQTATDVLHTLDEGPTRQALQELLLPVQEESVATMAV